VTIIDRREIEFDLEAVRRALELSPQACQAFALPASIPSGVRCNPAEGTLEVSYGRLTATRIFFLRAEALGAILISYCNRVGMPVPRLAEKGVRIDREQVVLVLTLRIDEVPQAIAAEGPVARLPEAVQAWAWIEPAH
jgi:hypothetical protein